MGAGKWRPEYSEALRDADVVIFQDNDGPGRAHAEEVAQSLHGIAKRVQIAAPPAPHKDVSDWNDAGATGDDIEALIDDTPPWRPPDTPQQGGAAGAIEGDTAGGPEPLRRKLSPPEPFPIDALGDVLGNMALALIDSVQAPPALCGQSVLAAAALAAQVRVDVELGGQARPCSEFFVTIGESGERKTAVDGWVLRPHFEYQRELARGPRKKDHTAEEPVDGDPAPQTEDVLVEEEEKPLIPIFILHEPTYEALVNLLRDDQPGIGLFAHEGGRLIGGYGLSPERRLGTIAGLSELWDGTPISRIRVKEGMHVLYGRRLSVHLMMQPGVAFKLLGDEMYADQGILSRVLATWPESTMGKRRFREHNIADSAAFKAYYARILDILEQPLPLAEGTRNELELPAQKLMARAKQRWIEFHVEVESELGQDGHWAPIRGFAAKAAKHPLRLAAILSFINDPEAAEISVKWLAAGVELARYYLNEALRLQAHGGTDPDLELAERLLEWVRGRNEFIYPRLVYQKGPARIRDRETALRIIGILERHKWLTPVGPMTLDGGRRGKVWRVVKTDV